MGTLRARWPLKNFGWPRGEDRKIPFFLRLPKAHFQGGGWLLVLGRVLTQHESEHRLQGDLLYSSSALEFGREVAGMMSGVLSDSCSFIRLFLFIRIP